MVYQAAIFDMDGLLLDTERLYIELGTQLGKDMGYSLPLSPFLESIGRDSRDAARIFLSYMGEDFPIDALRSQMRSRMSEAIRERGAPRKPYATEILTRLHEAGMPIAIATSTGRDEARFRIESAGWTGLFETFAFGDEVSHGKPEPDIFLLAASRLGAEPEHCVVLEDSPYGLRAARRAGMTSIWVPDLLTPESFPEDRANADFIVGSLREACDIIMHS